MIIHPQTLKILLNILSNSTFSWKSNEFLEREHFPVYNLWPGVNSERLKKTKGDGTYMISNQLGLW